MQNRVGLGTFPLIFIPKEDAKSIVREFIGRGGFYIDTAPFYGMGEAESLLGEVLKKFKRENFFVASKCGYVVEEKPFRKARKSSTYADIICECEKSLTRLGLDYLDLYFTHFPDRKTPFSETMRALNDLQKEGKIREIGVSNVTLSDLKEYARYARVGYVQNRFSLLNQSIDGDFEKYLLENNIKLIPYNVIDRGLLSSKVHNDIKSLTEGALQVGLWNRDKMKHLMSFVKDTLEPEAKKLNIDLVQLAIAWALAQKYVSFVLVGVANPQHLSTDLEANNIKLPSEIKV